MQSKEKQNSTSRQSLGGKYTNKKTPQNTQDNFVETRTGEEQRLGEREGNIQIPVCDGVTLKETSGVLLVALVWVYLSEGIGRHCFL